MLPFKDLPYSFFEPKPNKLIINLARLVNRKITLPSKVHKVDNIKVLNQKNFQKLDKSKHGIIFLANHSTHSDGQVITEIMRQSGFTPAIMTAYDVFLRSKINRFFLTRLNCFAVNRDGNNKRSLRCAIDSLSQENSLEENSLLIFPEGNVFFTNDKPAPFLNGTAYIAIQAQKKLNKIGKKLIVVPIALKYSFTNDIRPKFFERLKILASLLNENPQKGSELVPFIRHLGLIALRREVQRNGYLMPKDASDEKLAETLFKVATTVIEVIEKKLQMEEVGKKSPTLLDRIRLIRKEIHSLSVSENSVFERYQAEALANEALLAYRILSYDSKYLTELPNLDRCNEIVTNIIEDLKSSESPKDLFMPPTGKRQVIANIGEPIDLAKIPTQQGTKELVTELTKNFEEQIKIGIDACNAHNTNLGGKILLKKID